jgi:hypothetical protein
MKVSIEKFQAAIDYLTKKQASSLLSHKDTVFLSSCFRGQFYNGFNRGDAECLLNTNGWEIE